TVTITLDIYQNGTLLTSLTSPVLSSGSSYCFNVSPASIPGINASLGGFDFVATGHFAIGTTTLGSIKVGTPPDGLKPGKNNDYQIACRSCDDIHTAQDQLLAKECSKKVNVLPRFDCECGDPAEPAPGDCR